MQRMPKIKIQLTQRDIEILRFINECGFSEMPQIEKQFSLKKPRSYQIMHRLVISGLVRHQRIFHGRHGIFRLSRKGAGYTDLPPIDKINLSHYEHSIMLAKVYTKLRQAYPDAKLISERHLIKERFTSGVGKRGHMSDGLLLFPDEKQIAIEVELSVKSKSRIERIFKGYGAQFSINEVWYYCHEKLIDALRARVEKMPFIKIHNLKEFLV